jgi:hypothetical protein
MERQKIAEATLIEILIHETTRALGREFSGQANRGERRSGEPNWDANCGISGIVVVKAFGIALAKVQDQYDLD